MKPRSAFELIPAAAKVLAAVFFMAIVAAFFWMFDHHTVGFGTAMGLGAGAVGAAIVLLTGYVYGDASRRGMPPVAWTAIVLLVPNCVGFVLYFLLRKPLVHPCSRCGNGIDPEAAFCPRCGEAQATARFQDLQKTS